MTDRLFIGNLPWKITEEEIKKHFEPHGKVFAVKIVKDRETGRSKGFGFIDMMDANKIIEELDGTMLDGRPLTVKPAVRKK